MKVMLERKMFSSFSFRGRALGGMLLSVRYDEYFRITGRVGNQ